LPARAETVYARQVLLQGDVQKPAAPASADTGDTHEPGRRRLPRGRLRVARVLFSTKMEAHRSVHRRPEQCRHDGLGHVLGRGLHPDGHRRGRFDQLRRRRLPPDRVHRKRWHHVPGRPVREVWRRGYDRAAAGVLLPAGPASDSRPCGSLREGNQRPHGLHGPVPEVPQRASYDDVLQVLSGVLGPRPPIGTKADPPPSLCP
jgi:hypothetical protein